MARVRRFIWLILPAFLLFSCAIRPTPLVQHPLPLADAIRSLADNLMTQMRKGQPMRGLFSPCGETRVVIDPFIDMETNEVPMVSREIERIIIETGKRDFKCFELNRMTSGNLPDADYAMNGIIRLISPETPDGKASEKYYSVSASVIHLKTGKIVAHAEARIADLNLDYTLIPIHKDSPMYLKDRSLERSVAIASSPAGSIADKSYYKTLKVTALLTEAETAYGKADYKTGLALLKRAAADEEGQVMKTYAGLYSTYRKLGQRDLAEKAFASLLSISVEKNKMLTVKFLFDVNSVEFWRDMNLRKQYDIWLRQIGQYFERSPHCLRIIGHCSRTGSESYNNGLSLERAKRIQQLLEPHFPTVLHRSEAIGKGFRENIRGIGTDDTRDAIDRRVEFIVMDCTPL